MACKRCEDVLWECVDGGELPAWVEEHLAACESCRRLARTIRDAAAGLAALAAVEMPDSTATVLARLSAAGIRDWERATRPPPVRYWRAFGLACGAVTIAAVAAVAFVRGTRHQLSAPARTASVVAAQRPAPRPHSSTPVQTSQALAPAPPAQVTARLPVASERTAVPRRPARRGAPRAGSRAPVRRPDAGRTVVAERRAEESPRPPDAQASDSSSDETDDTPQLAIAKVVGASLAQQYLVPHIERALSEASG
jgi:hypothetical protein